MSEVNEIARCPNCPNHCPRNKLHCGKGRNYFAQLDEENEAPVQCKEKTSESDRDQSARPGLLSKRLSAWAAHHQH